MKKRFLSLLCVLALCLGLLPVTALADGVKAPDKLYVGNQNLDTYSITFWTTNEQGKLAESAENETWNVKYEPSSATLTLKGATIKGGSNEGTIPYGAGIYAFAATSNRFP